MKEFSLSSFVAGVMLGVILVGVYFLNDGTALPSYPFLQDQSYTSSTTSTSLTTETSGTVSVSDQLSGNIVFVDSVTVPPPGVWIAVREMSNGDLGNVLGAVRVSGPRSTVSISLLRATEPGRQYAIELYRDDANGAFDPLNNSVYVDFDTGAPVVAYFKTNS